MSEDFIAKRIYFLRTQKGISARDLSLTLGQSESYINKIENQKAYPSMSTFLYICDYFEISPEEFFSEENSQPILRRKLIEDSKNLNDVQLTAILNIIHAFKLDGA